MYIPKKPRLRDHIILWMLSPCSLFPTGVFDVTFVTSNHLYACRPPESNNQPVMPRYLCEVLSTSARKTVWRAHASFLFIVLRINVKNCLCGPVQWLLSLVMEQSIFSIPVQVLSNARLLQYAVYRFLHAEQKCCCHALNLSRSMICGCLIMKRSLYSLGKQVSVCDAITDVSLSVHLFQPVCVKHHVRVKACVLKSRGVRTGKFSGQIWMLKKYWCRLPNTFTQYVFSYFPEHTAPFASVGTLCLWPQ